MQELNPTPLVEISSWVCQVGTCIGWEAIIGVSSAIIALCALVLSIWQGVQMRRHNRLSFRPHLDAWRHADPEKGYYAVDLINNGLGPAIVKSFVVKVDGKQIFGDGTEPIEKALRIVFPNFPYQASCSYVAKGYSLAAKEQCKIAAVQFTGSVLPAHNLVQDAFNRADLEIVYKSVYGEEFPFSAQEEKSSDPMQRAY